MILSDAFLNSIDLLFGDVVLFLGFFLGDGHIGSGAMLLSFMARAVGTGTGRETLKEGSSDQE